MSQYRDEDSDGIEEDDEWTAPIEDAASPRCSKNNRTNKFGGKSVCFFFLKNDTWRPLEIFLPCMSPLPILLQLPGSFPIPDTNCDFKE